jgi:hypothetical protein
VSLLLSPTRLNSILSQWAIFSQSLSLSTRAFFSPLSILWYNQGIEDNRSSVVTRDNPNRSNRTLCFTSFHKKIQKKNKKKINPSLTAPVAMGRTQHDNTSLGKRWPG